MSVFASLLSATNLLKYLCRTQSCQLDQHLDACVMFARCQVMAAPLYTIHGVIAVVLPCPMASRNSVQVGFSSQTSACAGAEKKVALRSTTANCIFMAWT